MELELTRELPEPVVPFLGHADPAANEVATDVSPAPLTNDDVAEIAKELRSNLELWRADTASSHEALEAKLRRERAMGAWLLVLKAADLLAKGGRPPKKKTDDKVSAVSLEDLGIRREQSSRWQLEARVPEDLFTVWIEMKKEEDGEISSAALRRLAGALGLGKDPDDDDDPDDAEFDDVDTDMPKGPCPLCGRTCDCDGGLS